MREGVLELLNTLSLTDDGDEEGIRSGSGLEGRRRRPEIKAEVFVQKHEGSIFRSFSLP